MRQFSSFFAVMCVAILLHGCDRPTASPGAIAGTGKVVSLSPAATNLLVAMGQKPRIAGVSGYESDPEMRKLPKVGDYLNIDWERLAEIKPSLLILQGKRDRLAPGIRERAEAGGTKVVVLQIDRFDDILLETGRIAEFLGVHDAGVKLQTEMRQAIDTLRAAQQGPPKPALIVLSENGMFVAGRDNYLNDLLEAAGGTNVITASNYVTLDREKLRTLSPEHVFVLIPDATDASIETARTQLDLPAVREGRMHVIRSSDALLPGPGTIAIAQTMAGHLRSPAPTTQP